MIDKILRLYAFLFVGVLALFFLGVSLVALLTGTHNLQFETLPLEGAALTYSLLGFSLVTLFSVWQAFRGALRILFAVVGVVVLVLMVRGFFFSTFWFRDPSQFKWAVLLCLGALAAAAGGISQCRKG